MPEFIIKIVEFSEYLFYFKDAIRENSYYLEKPKMLRFGDTEKAFSEEKNIIEGELKVGGQEHFYLETHSSIAVPKCEDGEMEIFCSTQHPAAIQVRYNNSFDFTF
jgi:xanthine dehydrogenase/oxidase